MQVEARVDLCLVVGRGVAKALHKVCDGVASVTDPGAGSSCPRQASRLKNQRKPVLLMLTAPGPGLGAPAALLVLAG